MSNELYFLGQKSSEKPKLKLVEEQPSKYKGKKTEEPQSAKTPSPMTTPTSAKGHAAHDDKEKSQNGDTPVSEKKKASYASYKARDGPRALGSKELPQVTFKLLIPSPLIPSCLIYLIMPNRNSQA